jgi:release factor glutamine methyltransferase
MRRGGMMHSVSGEQTIAFGDLDIRYDDAVLRPRPWTLAQSEWGAELAAGLPEGRVLELCAGAGQIGLAFARATGRWLVQVDLDPHACELARANAAAAGIQTEVRCGPMLAALGSEERFPLILADPPYIRSDQLHRFEHDPQVAIDGGDDGLDLARACLAVIERHLLAGGAAVLQLGGRHQHETLQHELAGYGLAAAGERLCGEDRSLLLLVGV